MEHWGFWVALKVERSARLPSEDSHSILLRSQGFPGNTRNSLFLWPKPRNLHGLSPFSLWYPQLPLIQSVSSVEFSASSMSLHLSSLLHHQTLLLWTSISFSHSPATRPTAELSPKMRRDLIPAHYKPFLLWAASDGQSHMGALSLLCSSSAPCSPGNILTPGEQLDSPLPLVSAPAIPHLPNLNVVLQNAEGLGV